MLKSKKEILIRNIKKLTSLINDLNEKHDKWEIATSEYLAKVNKYVKELKASLKELGDYNKWLNAV